MTALNELVEITSRIAKDGELSEDVRLAASEAIQLHVEDKPHRRALAAFEMLSGFPARMSCAGSAAMLITKVADYAVHITYQDDATTAKVTSNDTLVKGECDLPNVEALLVSGAAVFHEAVLSAARTASIGISEDPAVSEKSTAKKRSRPSRRKTRRKRKRR